MRLVGLTGQIGSGKSTVSTILSDWGSQIIDADLLAREIVEPNQPALIEIAKTFGSKIILADGSLNRAALADIVFNDKNELEKLNQITHKEITRLQKKRIEEYYQADQNCLVIYDAALLFDKFGFEEMQKNILVYIEKEIQISRLIKFRNFTQESAEARIKNQLSQEKQAHLADYILDNSFDLKKTTEELRKIFLDLEKLPQITPDLVKL